ncbi:RsmB/NOP family class I SAM-dependent RNA methyltransferase [Nesterenkonia sp. HG001]|uniref:RsmB/NOP family class I SAM-dependent RNA methyltransferase n=1 Tax=Nesterenkonia sp. HG001 TaxID=2983207 RepID=UPI002AC6B8B9|nr:transcription antitermination factor NusB [Nesterenkonia sp. HG001]MDZ5075961.1 rRNA small subunit methyltransferase B [Nesterenkonia sp. HG001]
MSEQRPGRGRPRRHGGDTGESGGADRRDAAGRQRHRGGADGSRARNRSAEAPSHRRREADAARRTAWRVLRAVSRDDAYANLTLPAEIRRARLDRRDAGFATELAYGALRGQGTYDAIIAACVDRPLKDLDAPVLDALRLGAHQLLGMRVDAHAAVSETVALVRGEIGAGPGGFVNAVLRRISAQDRDAWLAQLIRERGLTAGSDEELGLRHAHPAWVVRSLKQALRLAGRGEELPELLAADNAAPEVHLVDLPGAGEDRLTSAVEAGAERSTLLDGAAVFRGGDVGRLPGVREGELRVQDIGSQWIARALATARPPEAREPDAAGEHWLDLCAGPGGKAALLAALAAQQGAVLVANEPAAHRAELVRRALSPVSDSAWQVREGDGRGIGKDPEVRGRIAARGGFDRILVDAPCTGLGALRRRPEARWRRSPSDLAELTVLQEELLDAAAEALAPGGLLGYATCSPHMAESVVQVEDLLRRRPDLRLLDAHDAMRDTGTPEAAQLLTPASQGADDGTGGTAGRMVQLWPHVHGTDAMFFALLHRPAEDA